MQGVLCRCELRTLAGKLEQILESKNSFEREQVSASKRQLERIQGVYCQMRSKVQQPRGLPVETR
jgi:hypothetical protein